MNKADEIQGNELLRAMSTTIAQKIASCAAHVLLKDGATILDAGCADGVATAWFAQGNPHIHVIGLDYDANFIEKARANYKDMPNLEFIQADLRHFDLDGRRLDAILNLSILHEPYSYTGYRTKTVEEILAVELQNLSPGGIIINRDFMLPDNPDEFVYLAITGESGDKNASNQLERLSYIDLLKLYAQEAMAFNNNDPQGHIKGFFLEEHTHRINTSTLGLPPDWRIFYLPHGFAWEFIWRKEYKSRFYPEANEKYGYWTSKQHRQEGEKLGARVLYSAPYENPWILENWYAPKVKIFDKNFNSLPLPASNFISVIQKPVESTSFFLKEHRQANSTASFLHAKHFVNTKTLQQYDLVKRPGSDVVDVFPWQLDKNGELLVFAKCDYPRPMANTQPRRMTPNLDGKIWSGHMIEPLSAAPDGNWLDAVKDVLLNRAEFPADILADIQPALTYYTAPADLNERVQSSTVEIKGTLSVDKAFKANYSGFSHDGSIRSFNAGRLLQAIQVGMLAEARLELNIYALLHKLGKSYGAWIGGTFVPGVVEISNIQPLDKALKRVRTFKVFNESSEPANWLEIVRSEFQERELTNGRERIIAKKELEFVIPNALHTSDISTNSVTLTGVFRKSQSGRVVVALQKINEGKSQFPAVQLREGYSGHICIPGFRLPTSVTHIQAVPTWISRHIGTNTFSVKKLGESYFPSLGVLPNRVFPFVVTEISPWLEENCDFYYLDELICNFHLLRDAHTMISLFRIAHTLQSPHHPAA